MLLGLSLGLGAQRQPAPASPPEDTLPPLPAGFVYLYDADGAILTDSDGAPLYARAE